MAKHLPTGTISGPNEPDPHLGMEVTFHSTSSGLAGNQYPMIVVAAYQDVDGDGHVSIPPMFEGSSDVVFTMLDHPDVKFLLGGGWSLWLQRGGPALCVARLYAYSRKGTVDLLAETGPWTAAGVEA